MKYVNTLPRPPRQFDGSEGWLAAAIIMSSVAVTVLLGAAFAFSSIVPRPTAATSTGAIKVPCTILSKTLLGGAAPRYVYTYECAPRGAVIAP